MKLLKLDKIVLSVFFLVAFLFANVAESYAAERLSLSIKNRYAESGVYYADVYATIPAGVTWTVGSQTIYITFNDEALKVGQFEGASILNGNSDIQANSILFDQKLGFPENIALNIATLFTYATFTGEEIRIGTLRWEIVDGTKMDDLEFNTDQSSLNNQATPLTFNSSCDSETCYNVEQPSSQQVALPVPALSTPADQTYGLDPNLNIVWNAVNHDAVDSYDYQVATDAAFGSGDIVDEGNTSSTQVSLTLNNGQAYYWRVRSSDEDMAITSDWSLPWMFKIKINPATLASPADGTTGVTRTPSLEWNAVTGADGYFVYVDDNTGTNVYQTVVDDGSTDVSIPAGELDFYSEYDWYVVAFEDVSGTIYRAADSDVWTFTTQVGITTLEYPNDNDNGVHSTVPFNWSDVNGADEYELVIWKQGEATEMTYTTTDSEYEATGLEYCTTYEWKVRAFDSEGNPGAYSNTFVFETEPGPPSLVGPADMAVNLPLNTTLEWNSVTCADSYNVTIEWGTESHTENIPATSTTYDYPSYEHFTDYTWYVTAVDQYGNQGPSSLHRTFRTTLDNPTLVSPANMSNGQPTTIPFEWDAVNGAFEYTLEVWKTGETADVYTSSSNTVTIPGFDPCSEYNWKVKAIDADGNEGAYSATWTFEVVPGAPMLASPADGSVNIPLNQRLEWDAVDCAVEYKVFLSWGENTNEVTVTNPYYDFPNYQYLTEYEWYVIAVDQYDNEGAASSTWEFTTIIEKPDVPVLVTPANNATEVQLTGTVDWDAAARAENYDVQISTTSTFDAGTIVHEELATTDTESDYSGLDNDTDHWWRVRAHNVGGTSDWTAANKYRTMLLAAPELTNPTAGEMNVLLDFDVEWNDAQGAVSYDLQISEQNNFSTLLYDETGLTGNSFTVSLDYGTTYYLRMRSKDTENNESNWEVIEFTTVGMPDFTGNLDVCDLSTHTYQAPDINGATYSWTVTGGTYTTVDARTIEVTFGDNTANIKLERSYGNLNDDTDKDVTLNDINYVSIAINSYHTYDDPCVNEEIDFDATITGGTVNTYEWDFGDGSAKVYGATPSHTFPGDGTYTVTVSVEGPDCTQGTGTYEITIVDDCPITITTKDFTGDDEVCKGSSPVMDADIFGGNGEYTIAWSPSYDFYDYTIEDAQLKPVVTDREYQIRVDDSNGLWSTAKSDVEVASGPTFDVASFFLPFPYAGDNINLNSKVSNLSPSTASLYWNKNGSQVVTDPTNEQVTIGISRYFVYAQDGSGCPSSSKRMVVYGFPPSKDIPNDDVAIGIDGSGFAYSYPNPVKDFVTLNVEFIEEYSGTIKLYNVAGQNLMSFTFEDKQSIERQIDLSEFASGMYLITIDTGSDTIVKRIIIE